MRKFTSIFNWSRKEGECNIRHNGSAIVFVCRSKILYSFRLVPFFALT